MKICKNCGEKLEDDEIVCKNCGTNVNQNETNGTNFSKASHEKRSGLLNNLKMNLRMSLSEVKSLLILLALVVFSALAVVYFAVQLVMFEGETSITNSCFLSLVFWIIILVICLIFFVFSAIFNYKEHKYLKEKSRLESANKNAEEAEISSENQEKVETSESESELSQKEKNSKDDADATLKNK